MEILNWFGYGSYRSELEKPNKSILSLCGGGVRGVVLLYILKEIEKRVGKKAGDIFSLTAATSVGCIIGSLLNLKSVENPSVRQYSAEDLTRIMEPKIRQIFDVSYLNEFKTLDGNIAPKYSSDGMSSVLTELFQETLAKDLLGDYCYTSFDTTDFKHAYFPFTSRNIKNNSLWSGLMVKEMLEGETAAPTYFSSKKIVLDRPYNIIDGAILANEPCIIAYTEAKTVFQCGDNMTLVSIGTGEVNYHLDNTDWGALHWGSSILPAMFSGQASTARSLCNQLLNIEGQSKKFYSVQFDLEKGHDALDDISDQNMEYLKDVAKKWIDSEHGDAELRELCIKLEHCY